MLLMRPDEDSGFDLPAEHRHDPGGKVRIRLRPETVGTADFSPCGRYRTLLTRTWDASLPTALWIGMNPSTAAADVDDPTVRREVIFSMGWGMGRYVKANVMDYRATHPRMLLEDGVEPRSGANLPAILAAAAGADIVVVAFGALHKRLRRYGEETAEALEAAGHRVMCMGTTKDGSPRHPLYLRGDAAPEPWTRTTGGVLLPRAAATV